MKDKTDKWIQTFSGKKFFYYDLDHSMFAVEDMAHAMANLARFNGHTREFYSVAQHSVIVSQIIEDHLGGEHKDVGAGLLHDAPEAYLGDVPKPFKVTIMEVFGPVEDEIYRNIAQIHDLDEELPNAVKVADVQALLLEKEQLLPVRVPWEWVTDQMIQDLPDITIDPLPPAEAKQLFLERYEQVFG